MVQTHSTTCVLLDAMAIQSHIFETNRLKIITGASLELDNWQSACRKKAAQLQGKVYTSAGGNVLAEFESRDIAVKFKDYCSGDCPPPGMEIAWAVAERQPGEANDLLLWSKLQTEVARYKAGDREASAYPARWQPAPPDCLFCGIRPYDDEGLVEKKKICSRCRALYDSAGGANSRTGIARLARYALNSLDGLLFPADLEDLVTTDNQLQDRIAAVVIDLNNMGDRIKSVVEQDGFEGLLEYSTGLQEDILESIETVLQELSNTPGSVINNNEKEKQLCIRPLVAAGDDMIFLLPARLWSFFTSSLLRLLADRGYAACAGVAVAKHKYPVNRLVLMAEDLCSNAKQHIRYLLEKNGKQNSGIYDTCGIDWYIHQETNMTTPLEVRRRRQVIEMYDGSEYAVSTGRPFTLENFNELQDKKQQWSVIKSQRKLHTLYRALQQGPKQTRQTVKYIFLRKEQNDFSTYMPLWKNINICDGDYPLWSKERLNDRTVHFTTVADQLELYLLEHWQKK